MLKLPNLNILEEFSFEKDIGNVNNIFQNLIIEIQNYLELNPILQYVKIIYKRTEKIESQNPLFYNIGVKRYFENKILVIEIFDNYKQFLPVILLREIYNCFVPEVIKENENIQIIINQIVLKDLTKLQKISEWKSLINECIVNYDLLITQLNKLDKFLKLPGAIQIIFEFIRRNIPLIEEGMEDIYYKIFKEYAFKTSKSINDDDIIETLRVLIQIFYDKEGYKYLYDYLNFFEDMKTKGIIQSELSKRKFTENMKWINKFSYISPSYQINWSAMNLVNIIFNFKFNPLLEKKKISKFIKQLPFLIGLKNTINTLITEISGFFLIPKVYLTDLSSFIEKLHDYGYIIEKECQIVHTFLNFLNLNYFREFHKSKRKIVNLNHKKYEKKDEISFEMVYKSSFYESKLSLLDWIILDRLHLVSVTGFTFEKRAETLGYLKSDLEDEILSQRALIENIEEKLSKIYSSPKFKEEIIEFLDNYNKFGFFFIKEILNNLLICLNLIEKILAENSEIKSEYLLIDFLKNNGISQSIEENIIFTDSNINRIIFDVFIPLYIKSKEKFRQEVRKYQFLYEFFILCSDLKIYNLKAMRQIIENSELGRRISDTKREKFETSYDTEKPHNITIQVIDDKFKEYLNQSTHAPVIKPLLINTIYTSAFSKYFPTIILKDTIEARDKLDKIKLFFPRALIMFVKDLISNENLIITQLYLPNLKEKEKNIFISILHNIFKKDLIKFSRFHSSGDIGFYSLRNFYDFDSKKFFYTKDLFEQYFLYSRQLFGKELKLHQESYNKIQGKFWSKEREMLNLVEQINIRFSKENIDFNISKLNNLLVFHYDLHNCLLDREIFNGEKSKYFFKNYIKSIKFLPALQYFGFGQYYVYIYPYNLDEIDFRLLLDNSFQKVQYPVFMDKSTSIFIKYLWPYRNPNLSYIHWLTKSKKDIREYCLFFIKKIFPLFHFNYNLSSNNWIYDSNRFKIYMQNILYNPNYKVQISKVKEFNVGNLNISHYNGPDSSDFENLTKIYNWHSIDIKSYILTKKLSMINPIIDLLEKGLIFPYLNLKNLDLLEKIYIILPNVKQELNKQLIEIFSFFNLGFIYEIEGEYFIYGMSEEVKFENGLMIKLYFPDCDLNEFIKLFELLFHYLKIEHYLILNDLVNGKNLLKSIYGNLNFIKDYNPLKNLTWNPKDKIWMNNKLFNEKFEPIYHDLIPEEKD